MSLIKVEMSACSADVEFLCEEVSIFIIPKFNMPAITLFDDRLVGPFRAAVPVSVPLWLGLQLRKAEKCNVQCPTWLEKQSLTEHLEKETNDELFSQLHFHYIEIAKLLLHYAREDIENASEVEVLLCDICDARAAKIRSGLLQLDGAGIIFKVSHCFHGLISIHCLS